jgi:hypothetical protein
MALICSSVSVSNTSISRFSDFNSKDRLKQIYSFVQISNWLWFFQHILLQLCLFFIYKSVQDFNMFMEDFSYVNSHRVLGFHLDHDKDDDELINVEFDFQDPHEDHFLSLNNLMKKSTSGCLMFPNLYGCTFLKFLWTKCVIFPDQFY